MICACLSEADKERIRFVAVRDYYDDVRWAHAVQKKCMR